MCFSVVILAWVTEVDEAPAQAPAPSPAEMVARSVEINQGARPAGIILTPRESASRPRERDAC